MNIHIINYHEYDVIHYIVGTLPQDFKNYLKSLYASYTPTQPHFETWPGPPAPVHEYISLALIKKGLKNDDSEFVQMSTTGKVDDLSKQNCSVELENIFHSNAEDGRRKVVLVEGASGSGKSTLSVYIAQQVLQGKLFQELDIWVPILIELRHESIQKARCLLDLLPNKNSMITQQAVDYISHTYGRGVLFILDGWDEVPNCYRNKNSILHDLIFPHSFQRVHLQESCVIVTSRPIASHELYGYASHGIEILGFNSQGLQQYVSKCLGNVNKADNLIKAVETNPSLAGIINLPLNASILLHLHENNLLGDIHTATQYSILSKLVLSIIDRDQRKRNKSENLTSLCDLPKHLSDSFFELCKFAYQKVTENKVEFSLPTGIRTLGLLQCVRRFATTGIEESFHFAHLSVQELLGAHYIASLTPEEQASIFARLHNEENLRFTAMFCYYSAITGLKNHQVIKVLAKTLAAYESESVPSNENRTRLLSILHFLYHAQNQVLSKQVAEHLKRGLNLRHITLTSSDCLCVGYFLSCILCQMDTGRFTVNLDCCSIGDQGCKYLVTGLCENLNIHGSIIIVTTQLSISLKNNSIGQEGCECLSSLLKRNYIIDLTMNQNKVAFKTRGEFIGELRTNTTLRTFHLDDCGLNKESIAAILTLSLCFNESLETLSLCFNDLHLQTIHLSIVIQSNTALKVLHLCNCNIRDEGLEHIASSLKENTSVTEIMLHNMEYDAAPNVFTENGISFLTNILVTNNTLSLLVLPIDLESFITENHPQEGINMNRKLSGYQYINVIGKSRRYLKGNLYYLILCTIVTVTYVATCS